MAFILLIANVFFNPGPLFYRQERMGLAGRKFVMWKFRTMRADGDQKRGHLDALELHRITPLGRYLRRSRLDELPNFINVLSGDMSVVGPRPDIWSHAVAQIEVVPHYRDRFDVRPGITGLAQVRLGYADSEDKVRKKARWDRVYVTRSRLGMEVYVILQTIRVMVTGFGAK